MATPAHAQAFPHLMDGLQRMLQQCVSEYPHQHQQQHAQAQEQADRLSSLLTPHLGDKALLPADHAMALESACRKQLAVLMTADTTASTSSTASAVAALIDISVWLAQHSFVDVVCPFILFEDAFELVAVSSCPWLIRLIQQRLDVLTTPSLFIQRSRLALLRTLNALLRRLSKTSDTAICGEVLRLIAYAMPADDKGGVNLAGKFNTSNITIIEPDEPSTQAASTGSTASSVSVASSASFYHTFWELQQYCYDPMLIKLAPRYQSFVSGMEAVFSAFEANRLPEPGAITPANAVSTAAAAAAATSSDFFPKYLTSKHLLTMQLSDASFRRHILTQFLILFHSMTNPNADLSSGSGASGSTSGSTSSTTTTPSSSTPTSSAAAAAAAAALSVSPHFPSLGPTQLQQVRTLATRAWKLLRLTPPNGAAFATLLQSLLMQEQFWMRWKLKNKAPAFVKPAASIADVLNEETLQRDGSNAAATTPIPAPASTASSASKPAAMKRAKAKTNMDIDVDIGLGLSLKVNGHTAMGGNDLAALWMCASNEECARDDSRRFLPDVAKFIDPISEEALELHPATSDRSPLPPTRSADFECDAVDAEALYLNKRTEWRALRLAYASDFRLFLDSQGKLSRLVQCWQERSIKAAAAAEAAAAATVKATPVVAQDEQAGALAGVAAGASASSSLSAGTSVAAAADADVAMSGATTTATMTSVSATSIDVEEDSHQREEEEASDDVIADVEEMDAAIEMMPSDAAGAVGGSTNSPVGAGAGAEGGAGGGGEDEHDDDEDDEQLSRSRKRRRADEEEQVAVVANETETETAEADGANTSDGAETEAETAAEEPATVEQSSAAPAAATDPAADEPSAPPSNKRAKTTSNEDENASLSPTSSSPSTVDEEETNSSAVSSASENSTGHGGAESVDPEQAQQQMIIDTV